jgi:Xaa-Pro aminopeptidase
MIERLSVRRVTPPAAERSDKPPVAGPGELAQRLLAVRRQMCVRGVSWLAVYGDREHFANLHHLIGFDPRFEEALLILGANGRPTLLVGNEGISYARIVPLEVNVVNTHEFSLAGQPAKDALGLETILRRIDGLRNGLLGICGWKRRARGDDPKRFDVPHYIVEGLRTLCEEIVNATDIFTDAADGVRARSSAAQLAEFEFAGNECSTGVLAAIHAVAEGRSELELGRLMHGSGLPLSIHPMVMSGERVTLGLASPDTRRLARGEPLMLVLGLRGGLSARAGIVETWDRSPLDSSLQYLHDVALPYVNALRAWYATLALGTTGGI